MKFFDKKLQEPQSILILVFFFRLSVVTTFFIKIKKFLNLLHQILKFLEILNIFGAAKIKFSQENFSFEQNTCDDQGKTFETEELEFLKRLWRNSVNIET
jgi:hypothetical protein